MTIHDDGRARDLWQRAKRILDEVLDAKPEEQPRVLAARCGDDTELRREVNELLHAAREMATYEFIERPAISLHNLAPEPSLVGEQVGPYEVVEEIGRGGMGSVYLALRKGEFERRVALKVIRRGLDTEAIVRRFHNERQILANLEHPNIARLYDGSSTTDGRPYLVMEHVEGVPIDRYCDQRHLSTRERLKLIVKVCDAVQAAHQNLVVHRDLKPSNILVTTDGEPHLLDFGIAKLISLEETDLTTQLDGGVKALTPEYASPEQIEGLPVTTSSDVYSLGVLLYELLSGHRPYDFPSANPAEMARIVCQQEPSAPSTMVGRTVTLNRRSGTQRILTPESVSRTRDGDPRLLKRRLAGDVDAIVLKALRKEPENRYATAAELARDIGRHLSGRPVLARRGTATYRTSKFLRRRWKELAAGIVVLVITGQAIANEFQAQEAELTATQFQLAFEDLGEFWLDTIDAVQKSYDKRDVPLSDYLKGAAAQLPDSFKDQPLARAALMGKMGQMMEELGDMEMAIKLTEEALAIRQRELEPNDHRIVVNLLNLAEIVYDSDQAERAPVVAQQAAAISRMGDDPDSRKLLAKALSLENAFHRDLGDFDAARRAVQESLALRKDEDGANSEIDTAKARHNLSAIDLYQGDYAAAEKRARYALEIRRKGDDMRHIASSLNNLGLALTYGDDPSAGIPFLEESIALRRDQYQDKPEKIASSSSHLGFNYQLQGQVEKAERIQRDALALLDPEDPQNDGTRRLVLTRLADVLAAQGNYTEAEKVAREARQLPEKAKMARANLDSLLGEILIELGQRQEGVGLMRSSWATLDASQLLETAIEKRRARERMERYGLLYAEGDAEDDGSVTAP